MLSVMKELRRLDPIRDSVAAADSGLLAILKEQLNQLHKKENRSS
jgi:hypothetical protein